MSYGGMSIHHAKARGEWAELHFAAYVIPTDTWYILPIRATHGQSDILLTPHSDRAKYEKYKEAWHLLRK